MVEILLVLAVVTLLVIAWFSIRPALDDRQYRRERRARIRNALGSEAARHRHPSAHEPTPIGDVLDGAETDRTDRTDSG